MVHKLCYILGIIAGIPAELTVQQSRAHVCEELAIWLDRSVVTEDERVCSEPQGPEGKGYTSSGGFGRISHS